MARITWDNVGDRIFQTGIDRGVLYRPVRGGGFKAGVSWSGLVSVETRQDGSSATPLYFDGIKRFTIHTPGEFSATLKAITYPDEFIEFDGFDEFRDGMYFDNQNRRPFGLCYRTLIGNDVAGAELGYKLHLLYNITAIPDTIGYTTISTNVDPVEFSWTLDGIPELIDGHRPTMHITIDSRSTNVDLLSDIEDLLYGESGDPEMPTIEYLSTHLGVIIITDNGDGTWTATGPDDQITISGVDSEIFTIVGSNAEYLTVDEDVYKISSN